MVKLKIKILFLLFMLFFVINNGIVCIIFSVKDKKGQVWVGNNEDYFFMFKNLVNIVLFKIGCFGYVYLIYNGVGELMQGGVNEMGLFFDFNLVFYIKCKEKLIIKEYFLGGNEKMFEYIMEYLIIVQEVMDLYKKYEVWGIEYVQFYLVDKYGNLGIIVVDSMWIIFNNYFVFMNYNLCYVDYDGDDCF